MFKTSHLVLRPGGDLTFLWFGGQAMASCRTLKAVLIDLSGTLHIEDAAVPGAQEALARSVNLQ